jgi:hypothetical protein
MMEGATMNAYLMDAKKATFTKVVLKNTTWYAIKTCTKKLSTRKKLSPVALS